MTKLIRGELYRLWHKKSLYLCFGILAFGYVLLAIIRSGGFNAESVVEDASNLFFLTPALIGGFLFSAIYTDDLNAKNLITLVGYGLSKSKIVAAKVILISLFSGVLFGLLPLFHSAVYAGLGCAVTAEQLATVYAVSLKYLLLTLAYASLSSIIVYGSQRATFAVVAYILFGFGIIGSLLTMATRALHLTVSAHLLSGITDRIVQGVLYGGNLLPTIMEYAAYILISSGLAAIAFNKKEMEF